MMRFWMRLGRLLGGILQAKMPPRCPQDAIKMPSCLRRRKMPPRCPQDAPRNPQGGPKYESASLQSDAARHDPPSEPSPYTAHADRAPLWALSWFELGAIRFELV